MDVITIKSGAVRYAISGRGTQWLVLLHELGGALETWSAVATGLEQSFKILRYDLRGAGRSERPHADFSIDELVHDLGDILDALDIDKCHLAGNAIGSGIAIRFAASAPARVVSLVLSSPVTGVAPDRKVYLRERAAQVASAGMASVIDDTLSKSYPPQVIRDRAVYEAYRARFLANDAQGYAALNRAFIDFDAWKDLPLLSCPVLVIAGLHDRLRTPDEAARVAAQIRDARLVTIDAGHIGPVQAPHDVIRTMQSFYVAIGAGF